MDTDILSELHIQGVTVDWNKIAPYSYLRKIPALDGTIHPCTYEETDSYQVTEMFINNREQILRRLLESE